MSGQHAAAVCCPCHLYLLASWMHLAHLRHGYPQSGSTTHPHACIECTKKGVSPAPTFVSLNEESRGRGRNLEK
eukprot:967692-Amphidinium_carterae.1